MENFWWLFTLLIVVSAVGGLKIEISQIKRKLRKAENAACDMVMIRNTLRENIQKEVQLEFLETEDCVFQTVDGKTGLDETSVRCEILDLDDAYVKVKAKYERKKQTFESLYVLPIENIRSVVIRREE